MAAAGRREEPEGDSQPAAEGGGGADAILDHEPFHIAERAASLGEHRLRRSTLDILVTAFIGGVEVFFGGLVAALVIGAAEDLSPAVHLYTALALAGVVFPVGFLFVIMGRSELFTENFLIPVVAAVNRRIGLVALGRIWIGSWVGNIAGCATMAALLLVPHVLGAPVIRGYVAYTNYKLGVPATGTFLSAMLAGTVMTVLTWLLLAIRSTVGKVVAIWAAGYTLFASNLSHAVVGSAILFIGFSRTSHSWLDVAAWLGLATAGNLCGGIVFVTFFRMVQTWEKQRDRHRSQPTSS